MSSPVVTQYLDPTFDFERDRAKFVTEVEWEDGTVIVADSVVVDLRQMVDPTSHAVERCTTQAIAKAKAIIVAGR